MAITATLVYAGHNRLRYLVASTVGSGETVEITSSGAATPDLQTDSLAGPLKQISRVKDQGYGLIPVGGISSQAQAQALLLSQNDTAVIGQIPVTAIVRYEQITGTAKSFFVDANQGSGDPATPSLFITNAGAFAASAYVDIEIPGAIGA